MHPTRSNWTEYVGLTGLAALLILGIAGALNSAVGDRVGGWFVHMLLPLVS